MSDFADSLTQKELPEIGAWRNPKTGRYVPPSKTTIHRVMQNTDPKELEEVLRRYTETRTDVQPALAADGKRLRGANRNGDSHYETVTLVEHQSGLPLASLNYHQKGDELCATRQLLADVEVAGKVITLDALHANFESIDLILAQKADYMVTLKDNVARQLDVAKSMRWRGTRVRRYAEAWNKDHGRLEQRRIEVLTVDNPDRFSFSKVRQVFRIRREREVLKQGDHSLEYAYGITSVPADRADARQLLEWNRGHWSVENKNHHIRDRILHEDDDLQRTGNAPSNQAMCNNIALALIFHQGKFKSVSRTLTHFNLNRNKAIAALHAPS